MTTTQTHQPVAYQIEDANGEFMCLSRTNSLAKARKKAKASRTAQRAARRAK